MNRNKTTKKVVMILSACLTSVLLTPANAADEFISSKLFSKSNNIDHKAWYVGGALGSTMLEPRVLVTTGSVTENTSAGYKLYAGYNLNEHLSAELFYADLGKATVDLVIDESDVEYQAYGVALAYNHRISYRFKLSGKLGISALDNQVDDGISFERINDIALHKGLGLEYIVNRKLSVRVDYDHFDQDYQMFAAGIKYSF